MTEMKVTIMNEREFNGAMQKAGPWLVADMERALTYCAIEFVEKPAARYAQRNFRHPTGNLPASIHTVVASRELVAKVGTNLVYAPLREFGGNVRTPWPGSGPYRTIHHTGRPFLTKAFKEADSKIRGHFNKVLDRLMKKIDAAAGGK